MHTGTDTAPSPKLGLALSGGGFRASFFHLGVLKRLAEMGLLGQVEVLSTVSGGSIIAALYVLILKREMEALPEDQEGELPPGTFEAILEEVEAIFVRGVRKDLRTRLLTNPFATTWMMLTSWSLGDRMARLYEKHLYGSVIRELREAEQRRTGRAPDWKKGSIPLRALRFSPPGVSFQGGLDAYNNRHDTKIPKFILNATCLNSGRNWRFTSVEIGDPLLGIFRADETGVPATGRGEGNSSEVAAEGDLVPRLKRDLEGRTSNEILAGIRGDDQPAGVSGQVLVAEYLLRLHRKGRLEGWEGALGVEDEGPFMVPTAWMAAGLKLEELLDAEFGDLYPVKVQAWYLHRGAPSYRESGSESRFWEGLLRIGGPRVEALRDRAGADPAFRGQLMDFVTDLYYARIAWMAGRRIGHDIRRIRLSEAVATSACFPPLFAPFSFLGLFDDRRIPIVRLVDGGVYDNQGLTALYEEECTHIIASDAGMLLEADPRVQGSRASMLGRIIAVITGALRESQLQRLFLDWKIAQTLERARAAGQSKDPPLATNGGACRLRQVAFFHMSKQPEMGEESKLEPHPVPEAVAGLRTDLDAFGDVEIASLVYQGYDLCDRFVRKHFRGAPFHMESQPPPEHPPTPPRTRNRNEERRVLEVGSNRAFRAMRLGSFEAWGWTLLAAALIIGGGWTVPVSVQDLGRMGAWVLDALRVDVSARVPLGLVILAILSVAGFRMAWPSLYRRVSRIRGIATLLKLARAGSGLVLVFLLFPPLVAFVASLVALFSYYCQARPFLRVTKTG